MQKLIRSAAALIISLSLTVLLPGIVSAADLPSRITLHSDDLEIPVVSNLITPSQLFIPSNGIALLEGSNTHSNQGYIFYGFNWQRASAKLARIAIGQEITLNFPSARAKTFVVSNVFSVSPKSDDKSDLAKDPDTLLIYSSQGVTDREQLVIMAKVRPATEVSSL